jgi:hypothetical protein
VRHPAAGATLSLQLNGAFAVRAQHIADADRVHVETAAVLIAPFCRLLRRLRRRNMREELLHPRRDAVLVHFLEP